jgi:hypothetical protein
MKNSVNSIKPAFGIPPLEIQFLKNTWLSKHNTQPKNQKSPKIGAFF